MGILTGDANLIDATLSEVLSLPVERRQELDTHGEVDYLLVQYHLSLVCGPGVLCSLCRLWLTLYVESNQ